MIFVKSSLVWLILMLAETLHGIFRTFVLAPNFGDLPARQVSVLTGSTIIFLITLAFVKWFGTTDFVQLFRVGMLWAVLTVVFEIALGRFVFGFSWKTILADYDLLAGRLMLLGLIFMVFCPLLAAKIRN